MFKAFPLWLKLQNRRIRWAASQGDSEVTETSDDRLLIPRVPYVSEGREIDARRLCRAIDAIATIINPLLRSGVLYPATDDGEGNITYKLDILKALKDEITSPGVIGSPVPGVEPILLDEAALVRLITRADGTGSGIEADLIRGQVPVPTATVAVTITTGTHNNYSATAGRILRVTTSGGAVTITGLSMGQTSGHLLLIRNLGADTLTLSHEAAGSLAANRFTNTSGLDVIATAGSQAVYLYDTGASRWAQII